MMGRTSSAHGEMGNTYKSLGTKLKANKPLARPGRRWKDNIKLIQGKFCWSV